MGDHRWDPRNETEKAEQYFFKWESDRVKKTLSSKFSVLSTLKKCKTEYC